MSDLLSALGATVGALALFLTILALYPALVSIVESKSRASAIRQQKLMTNIIALTCIGAIVSSTSVLIVAAGIAASEGAAVALRLTGVSIFIAAMIALVLIPVIGIHVARVFNQ